jgi:hypothetical protein
MLADHPFLDVLWTGFLLFLWVGWIFLVVMVLMDIFRRDDASGWVKALWALAIVVVPWLGVLVYLITQGDEMGQRRLSQLEAAQARMTRRVRDAAASEGNGGAAAEIERAKALLDAGAVTPAEYEQLKQRALA